MLEVKIATPKEEMRAPVKKDQASKAHRGIGFITFASSGSVENLMADTHELGGATVVVDRATPKEDDFKPTGRMSQGGYGAYDAYISAATRYAAVRASTLYDHRGTMYGRGESSRGMGKKIFVGRLPQEATVDDLHRHFGRFGRIVDVYIPKVAIDSATPVDDVDPSFMMNPVGPFRGFGGLMHPIGRMYGGMHFENGVMALGAQGHREQIGGTGHTKRPWNCCEDLSLSDVDF